MQLGLNELELLLKNKELVLEDGAKLVCGDKIRPVISYENGVTEIDFESPFVYILIEKMGGLDIFDIKRRVNKIILTEKTVTLVIDSFPDITRSR